MRLIALISCCALAFWLTAGAATADCIDINTAPKDRLTDIVHVGDAFAAKIVAGRPWE
jgi:DNA uptake protein ComE-like DNA-binding protein